jgi:hypothetical protein
VNAQLSRECICSARQSLLHCFRALTRRWSKALLTKNLLQLLTTAHWHEIQSCAGQRGSSPPGTSDVNYLGDLETIIDCYTKVAHRDSIFE